MQENEQLIHTFYTAFQRRDFKTMQDCYHPEAKFYDPAFQHLDAREVRGMWEMLLTASRDLEVKYTNVVAGPDSGSCHWEAWYTFSKTGKKVHNRIDASFRFRDGRIIDHTDRFSFWKWSGMALGLPGLLLGWSPMVKNKVRSTARNNLNAFLSRSASR